METKNEKDLEAQSQLFKEIVIRDAVKAQVAIWSLSSEAEIVADDAIAKKDVCEKISFEEGKKAEAERIAELYGFFPKMMTALEKATLAIDGKW